MRGQRVGLTMLVLASAAVLAATAAGVEAAHPQPKTLATFRGPVGQFAQSGRYLAWLTPPKSPYAKPAKAQCQARLTFLDLRTGRRSSARGTATGRGDELLGGCDGPEDSMALAGRRTYWQAEGVTNGSEFEDLMAEAPGQTRSRNIDYQSIGKSNIDSLVPVSSDGSSVYAVSSPDDATPGPIRRWVGTNPRAVTGTIPRLTALGAGEGRFAFAGMLSDCANGPAWSAASGEIAFSRGLSYLGLCPGGIWIMNPDGTNLRRIATVGANPDWSPDGSKIAFDDGTHVIVANADGSSPDTRLQGKDPAWSPDGSRIAFDRGGALYVASADGTGAHQIAASALDPAWSPDGAQIVFARPFGKTQGLGIVNADGTGVHSLTISADSDPAWSPNGKLIAYVRDGLEIRVVAPDGSGQRSLDFPIVTHGLAWSPDSSGLVFAAEDDQGDPHLFSQKLASSHEQTLTRPLPGASIVVESHRGSTLGQFTPSGRVAALAISTSTLAALIIDRLGPRIEIFLPHPRTVVLGHAPNGFARLSASGTTIIYHVGEAIYALDSRQGRPHLIAYAASRPIGLSIVGRRVAWAEDGKPARIRAITLP